MFSGWLYSAPSNLWVGVTCFINYPNGHQTCQVEVVFFGVKEICAGVGWSFLQRIAQRCGDHVEQQDGPLPVVGVIRFISYNSTYWCHLPLNNAIYRGPITPFFKTVGVPHSSPSHYSLWSSPGRAYDGLLLLPDMGGGAFFFCCFLVVNQKNCNHLQSKMFGPLTEESTWKTPIRWMDSHGMKGIFLHIFTY